MIDIENMELTLKDRIGMAAVLEVIRDVSRDSIDMIGAEAVAGIVEEHCGGNSRRSALMALGTLGQAHAQLKDWRRRIAGNPAMKPETKALDILMELFQREGERLASEIGGEFLVVEMEIERSLAGRDVCDICTLSYLYDMACEGLEAIA